MKIKICSGTGRSTTKKGAFDKALWEAGLANYNLIEISSIIPEEAEVERANLETTDEDYGDKAYVVLSKSIQTEEGREAWASLGWHYEENKEKGVFVEESGKTEDEVTRKLRKSVKTLHDERIDGSTELKIEKQGIECKGNSVCAVVAALYETETWNSI